MIISIFLIVTGNMQAVTQNIEGSVRISAFVAYDHEEQSQMDLLQARSAVCREWFRLSFPARIRI